IVTGAASGIGLATTNLLIEAGAFVAAVDYKGHENLPSIDALLPVRCDVSDLSQVKSAVAAVLEKWGHIDVLVNNAGVMDNFAGVDDTSDAMWQRCMKINLDGVFFFSRECFPHLIVHPNHKGAIVNVASVACKLGSMSGAAYTASKHAVIGLTKNTAKHNKGKLTCNVVLPGATLTNIFDSLVGGRDAIDPYGQSVGQTLDAMRPKDFVQPEDVARAILFLAFNPMVNGAVLEVDNGWTA
ncbi:NAD(P)-binding protein, partial [Punctularia strigosozonata HHB-11173 SS5]|uniref:NAD(P)-binding protein n=1 Tax=Punctularia strigosozonata (strain HHB-11173) TaxID=741275 RepID=UPI00044162A1